VADGVQPTNDIKLVLLLQEAFRHCKVVGGWGDAGTVLTGAGIPIDDPGVIIGRKVTKAFTDSLRAAVGLHRVWARANAVMASAAPPAHP
jgi:catalase